MEGLRSSSAPADSKEGSSERPTCIRSGPLPEATAVVSLSLTLDQGTASTWTGIPVCLVKSCISAVKLVLSSIVQTWIGPLSVLADGVGVDPPQAAVQNATAISAVAVMSFPNALFMEPPPRLCSRFASCRPRAVTGYGTGYGETSPGPANLSRGELRDVGVPPQSARLAPGVRNL